jgi:5'-nucleotidase
MSKPTILVVNDDGYFSEGIQWLVDRCLAIGDVWMVAPTENCSGFSHKISIDRPLRIRSVAHQQFAVNGSPVDCVFMARHVLLKDRPIDFLISGINHGYNLGEDVAYSGTVAAAYEGQAAGIRSLALSTPSPEMKAVRGRLTPLVDAILAFFLLGGITWKHSFFNINFSSESTLNLEFTRIDTRDAKTSVYVREDPRGQQYYWLGPYHPGFGGHPGTDFAAVRDGRISVTPIQVQLTDEAELERLKANGFLHIWQQQSAEFTHQTKESS